MRNNIWWTPAVSAGRVPTRDVFFKRDRPRAIDRYIDYFGGSETQPAPREMIVDDVLLETSA